MSQPLPLPLRRRAGGQPGDTYITLEWDPPPIRVEAYLMCDAVNPKPSWSRDPTRTSCKFNFDTGPYWVMALEAGAYGTYP